VKLGYQVDNGGKGDREHLWFLAHELGDDTIDATLGNQPHRISRMNDGDRGRHSADLISDWTIMTPVGMMTPRSTAAAHMVRADPEGVRQKMSER
jgi:hypothetical protein